MLQIMTQIKRLNLMNKNACPFCGSTQAHLYNPTVWDRPDMQVYQCESCDLVYLFPMMTEEEEKTFYANYNEYLRARDAGPKKSIKAQFEVALSEAERRVSYIRDTIHSKMRILEIGSSTGAFSKLIKDYVFEVLGVEPCVAHATYMTALGLPHVADIDKLNMRKRERFDGVAMFHVLEHIRDPLFYLKNLREKYLAGGYLWVEVPNVKDALLTFYRCEQFVKFYCQSTHCCYFSPETLRVMTEAAGFKTVELIPVQRYDLSNHMCWLQYGKPGGTGKYNQFFSKSLNAAYAECLKEHWLCDTIFGIFQS